MSVAKIGALYGLIALAFFILSFAVTRRRGVARLKRAFWHGIGWPVTWVWYSLWFSISRISRGRL